MKKFYFLAAIMAIAISGVSYAQLDIKGKAVEKLTNGVMKELDKKFTEMVAKEALSATVKANIVKNLSEMSMPIVKNFIDGASSGKLPNVATVVNSVMSDITPRAKELVTAALTESAADSAAQIAGQPPTAAAQAVTGAAPAAVAPATPAAQAAAPAPAATAAPSQPSDHDTIVMLNGTMIDADIREITPTQIKYNTPGFSTTYSINKSNVFSIKHKTGVVEVINTPGQQTAKSTEPALDPNKLYFSFSVEPSGFIAGGPSATLEFTKGSIITSVHASFPTLALNSNADGFGFGAGAGLNYFWGGPIGGFFVGGVFEWNMYPYSHTFLNPYGTFNIASDSFTSSYSSESAKAHSFIFALQGGYKFVLKNGIYFRTGVAAGMNFSPFFPSAFYYKPDIATGYIF